MLKIVTTNLNFSLSINYFANIHKKKSENNKRKNKKMGQNLSLENFSFEKDPTHLPRLCHRGIEEECKLPMTCEGKKVSVKLQTRRD